MMSDTGRGPVIVASHRRAGTHLAIDTLTLNFPDLSKDYLNLDWLLPLRYTPDQNGHLSVEEFARKIEMIEKDGHRVIIKTHSSPGLAEFRHHKIAHFVESLVSRATVVYVYRDGRDTLTSLYHYSRGFMLAADQEFGEFLAGQDKFYHGVPEINGETRVRAWKDHVEGWLRKEDVLGVSYESLRNSLSECLPALAAHIDAELPPKMNRAKFRKPNVLQRALRRLGLVSLATSAIAPRKGVVGDWRNHFTPKDLELFDRIASDTMTKLGYAATL